MEEDIFGHLQTPLHIFGAFSNLGRDPKDEYYAHDNDVAPGRNNGGMS